MAIVHVLREYDLETGVRAGTDLISGTLEECRAFVRDQFQIRGSEPGPGGREPIETYHVRRKGRERLNHCTGLEILRINV